MIAFLLWLRVASTGETCAQLQAKPVTATTTKPDRASEGIWYPFLTPVVGRDAQEVLRHLALALEVLRKHQVVLVVVVALDLLRGRSGIFLLLHLDLFSGSHGCRHTAGLLAVLPTGDRVNWDAMKVLLRGCRVFFLLSTAASLGDQNGVDAPRAAQGLGAQGRRWGYPTLLAAVAFVLQRLPLPLRSRGNTVDDAIGRISAALEARDLATVEALRGSINKRIDDLEEFYIRNDDGKVR